MVFPIIRTSRESVCACVCVRERGGVERERERERERARERERERERHTHTHTRTLAHARTVQNDELAVLRSARDLAATSASVRLCCFLACFIGARTQKVVFSCAPPVVLHCMDAFVTTDCCWSVLVCIISTLQSRLSSRLSSRRSSVRAPVQQQTREQVHEQQQQRQQQQSSARQKAADRHGLNSSLLTRKERLNSILDRYGVPKQGCVAVPFVVFLAAYCCVVLCCVECGPY